MRQRLTNGAAKFQIDNTALACGDLIIFYS
jgi:hypothetical protein